MIKVLTNKDSITFEVRVLPRSSKSEIVGEFREALKIKINAPPVDGAANKELINVLSKNFGVSKSSVEIVSGETSKTKRVKIYGIDAARFRQSIE